MRVALYARVSTADKGQDPETQLLKLRAVAVARAYELSGEPYIDFCSGKDSKRPALDRMIADARQGKFNLVLCTKLDRMMRSSKNLYNILQQLESWNVQFECADQDISTRGPSGKLLLAILSGVAEYERDLISSRVRDGIARRKSEGLPIGRQKGAKDKRKRKSRRSPLLGALPPIIPSSRKARGGDLA